MTRVILFTGKGGVGKTTVATATGLAAAQQGRRTLVMSTDPAHSVADALAIDVPATGRAHRVDDRLYARHAHPEEIVGPSWRIVADYLAGLLDGLGVDPVVAEEMTTLPGADEISALLALQQESRDGDWDVIIVDCAPSAETLRLLALPQTLAWHLKRWLPGQGARGGWRPAAASVAGLRLPGSDVVAAVDSWHTQMSQVAALVTGRQASVRLVLTPEQVVIAESRRTWTTLGLYGLGVDGIIVNRVLPSADASQPWLHGWNRAQAQGVDHVTESFAPLPVTVLPFLAAEPVGLAALGHVAEHLSAGGADLFAGVPQPPLRLSRTSDGYELCVDLPLVTASQVDLQRRDDDLIITVSGRHRVVTLPARVARCEVASAGMRDTTLRVRLVREVTDGVDTAV